VIDFVQVVAVVMLLMHYHVYTPIHVFGLLGVSSYRHYIMFSM